MFSKIINTVKGLSVILLLVITIFSSLVVLNINKVNAQCHTDTSSYPGSIYHCCQSSASCCGPGRAINTYNCSRQAGVFPAPGAFSKNSACLTTSHPSCGGGPETCSPSVWTPGDNQCGVGSCGTCQRRTGINRSTPSQAIACSDVCIPDNTCGGCCTSVAPTASTLTSPVNNFIAPSNNVTVLFTAPASWGNGCPNINGYRVHYRINDPVRGVGTWIIIVSGSSPVNITALEWGVRYEWGVHVVNNGSNAQTWSGSRFFTTNRPPVTTYNGISLYGNSVTNQCGSNWSGRYLDVDNNGSNDLITSNPVQFNMSATDADSDQFAVFAIALLPTTGPYAENGATVPLGIAISKAHGANTFVAGYDRRDSRGYVWSNNTTVSSAIGDLVGSGGRVSLLGISQNTIATQTGNSASGSVRLRFENTFPSGNYNIYIITTSITPAGNEISEGANTSFPRPMERVGTWGIDTIQPSVSIAEPTFTSATQFAVTYNHSDNTVISQRLLETSATKESATLSNNLSQTINYPIADTFYSYPSFAAASPQTITYNDLTPANQSAYTFRLTISDQACNTTIQNVGAIPPLPWMIVNDGQASAGSGLNSVLVPNLNLNIPLIFSGQSYLSTFGTISASGSVTGTRSNPNNLNLNNYTNLANQPTYKSDYRNWYDHLLNRVRRNETVEISEFSQINITGNISTSLSGIAGTKKAFVINGNTLVSPNTVCDMQAMIFVNGNLTIQPNVNTPNPRSACIFITKGNVEIQAGTLKTSNIDINSSNLSSYDNIDAYIIADGAISIPEDTGIANRKWDGLNIRGGLSGVSLTVRRDINNIANRLQPAFVINYDPRFKTIFTEDFGFRGFSIREE